MDDQLFGARFIEELRRLTRSTAGFDYRDVERIRRMDREEFRAAMGKLAPAAFWEDPAASPEALARDVFARRAEDISVIIGIMGGFT